MTHDYILTVFITMVTVIDPIGLVPFYLPIANRFPADKRKYLIIYSCIIAFVTSTGFLFAGKYLFRYLEIDFNALYIAGGILMFLIGLDMIYTRPKRINTLQEEQTEPISNSIKDVAVFPLAIPMLAGPGTIATMIMFSSRYDTYENYAVVLLAALVAFAFSAITMTFSSALSRILGRIGINVLDRIIGIVLCSLAVQFVINAVRNIVSSVN